jgi:hypothetical protein
MKCVRDKSECHIIYDIYSILLNKDSADIAALSNIALIKRRVLSSRPCQRIILNRQLSRLVKTMQMAEGFAY